MTTKFGQHLHNLPPETATFMEGKYILKFLSLKRARSSAMKEFILISMSQH